MNLPIAPDEAQRLETLGLSLEWARREQDNGALSLVLRDLREPKQLPLVVDFVSGTMMHRLRSGLGKGQPLPRALGVRAGVALDQAPSVFDATAGLGVDALIIAALGCKTISVERSPTVFALLEDGWRRFTERAASMTEIDATISLSSIVERLKFKQGDARYLLESISEAERPSVVYMDPMYPEQGRSKSALPKKGMQIFRRLIGDDSDAIAVFEVARIKALDRVVVKRPLHAPPLAGRPTHVFSGKTARYDMYLCR